MDGRFSAVDPARIKCTHDPVLEHHVAKCDEEWKPGLVERQQCQDHEEQEMRLGDPAREMHEERGADHQT
jgi:hypothetical protein